MTLTSETPFLNLMKTATEWNYNDNQGKPTPDQLDANGYPTTIVHGGIKCITNIFPASSGRSGGNYVATWTGDGAIGVGVPNSGTVTTVSGSKTGSGGSGRYVFTTTSLDALVISINALPVTDLKLFYGADETLINAGQIFGVQFLSVMRSGNPGVLRFLDWFAANTSNVTSWATRKPVSYISYVQDEYRPSLYAGVTTTSGVKHSVTFGSGSPVSKQTMHVVFKATPISVTIGTNATVTWGGGSPVAHGMNIGQSFQFNAPFGIALPSPISSNTTYWVTSVPTSSTLTFSATKGGANVDTTGGTLTGVPFAWAIPAEQAITLSGATVTWANHGLSIGDPVKLRSSFGAFGLPTPYNGIQAFYIIAASFGTNSFQISTTPGGAAISYPAINITGCNTGTNQPTLTIVGNNFAKGGYITIASVGGLSGINGTWPIININGNSVTVQVSGSVTGTYTSGGTATPALQGSIFATGVATLNMNSTGDVPLLVNSGTPDLADSIAPYGGQTATLIYDAEFGGWLTFGGTQFGPSGIGNKMPPEIMVELCKQIGAHPHFVAPVLACDPMTDWHTQLATYVKNNGPSWMKPRFEPPNELWNPLFIATAYSNNKGVINWGPSNFFKNNDWYGKVTSTIGQDINAVYGGTPSVQTSYAMICSIQTDQAGSSSNDPRLTSALYMAQAASAQSGYVKSAAYNWATHSCVANYWSPGERGTPQEVIDGYNWAVTNDGNSSAQNTIATAYINTANTNTTVGGSPASNTNLIAVKARAVACKAWAVALGSGQVSKMTGYEGGYSPDYPNNAFNSSITAITKTASAVVTVGAYNADSGTGPQVGAPAVVGMPMVIKNVGGMSQINNGNNAFVTVTAGTPGQVTYNSHGFSAGQAIFFQPLNTFVSRLPTGAIFAKAYFVKTVLDANTFTIAATSGGTALALTGSQVDNILCNPCWVVTAVSGSDITLNVDSSAFSTYTSGGDATPGSIQYLLSMLRRAGKFVSVMQGFTTQLYNDFAAAGGEYPSCYLFAGTGNVWSVWDPDIYVTPTPPQWAAIAAFNH